MGRTIPPTSGSNRVRSRRAPARQRGSKWVTLHWRFSRLVWARVCQLSGAGLGIGRLAASAMGGTARQPSAGGDIRTTMIIAAALIEGVTLFALVVCIILAVKT